MSAAPVQILLIEDNPGDARLLREALSEAGPFACELTHVDRLARGLEILQERPVDILLLDLTLADAHGLAGLRRTHAAHPFLPIVVLTGLADEALALEAVQIGAQDYLVKGKTESQLLVRSIRYAIERSRAEETTRRLVREQTEHAVASAERARLHALFMQAPAAICVLRGPEHVFELANPSFVALMGGRDVVGKPLLKAFPELAGQGIAELLSGVLQSGQPWFGKETSYRLDRRGDGQLEPRIFDFVFGPMRNADDTASGIMVVASDVTDQVQARARIDEARRLAALSEERFQLLAEAIPQMVWSMSPDGKDAYLSPRWYQYTGQSVDQPLADKWREAIHPEDYDRCFALWAEAAAKRTLWEMEYRLKRSDGVYRWHLGRSVAHYDEGGNVIRWYGTATDIDDQRKAIRSRDDLLATVSHDLKNPLGSITLATEMLRRTSGQGPLASGVLKYTAPIARAAARMEQLMRDLLDMASIESGHLSVDPAPLRATQLLDEATESIQPLATAKGVQLEVETALDGLQVQADKGRVLQVFSNILGNAVKFTPAAGKIAVKVHPGERVAQFAVSDTGPGIAPEQLPHVFDRFWQAKETARAGTDLGLAICKGIIEQHGGTIRVESTVGVGTTFFFTLPIASAESQRAN